MEPHEIFMTVSQGLDAALKLDKQQDASILGCLIHAQLQAIINASFEIQRLIVADRALVIKELMKDWGVPPS